MWRLIPIAGPLLVAGLIAWWLRGALARGRISTRAGDADRNRQPGAFWFSVALLSLLAAFFVVCSVVAAAMVLFTPACSANGGVTPCHD